MAVARSLYREALTKGVDLNSLCSNTRLLGFVEDASCVQMLLDMGVKCEGNNISCLPDVYDSAPAAVFETILRSGANPNGMNKATRTALHGLPPRPIAEVLFKHGADPSIKDRDGRTPLDMAFENQNETAIQYLREFGALSSKFRSQKHAEQVRLKEDARGIFLRATSSGGRCGFNVSSSGTMLSASGNQWATVVGAKLKVSVRCPGGAAIHWVLMKNSGEVVIAENNPLVGGQGVLEMDVVEKSGGDPLLFFVSDDFVGSLAKAVETKNARFAGQVTLTAGVPPNP